MECPICLEIIYKSAVPSCSHHFCYTCLKKLCLREIYKCPVCKFDIYEIKFDFEFDFINHKFLDLSNNRERSQSFPITNNNNKIIIKFNNSNEAGITLENNKNSFKRLPGVRVKNIKTEKKMYKSGIRKNDIILFINNIPCSDHVNAIKIINYCSTNGKEIICELLK